MTASTRASGSWPAQPSSVPAARRLVREHLRSQGLADLSDDAELLVAELVGNVVLHVGGTVEVGVQAGDGVVLVEVSDASPVGPQIRMFSATSSTGRGLRLVQALASEYGVRTSEAGKAIWVKLTTTTAGRGDGELAESFAGVDWLAELAGVDDNGNGSTATARVSGSAA